MTVFLDKQRGQDGRNRNWLVALILEGFFCKTGAESLFYFCSQGLKRQTALPHLVSECEQ